MAWKHPKRWEPMIQFNKERELMTVIWRTIFHHRSSPIGQQFKIRTFSRYLCERKKVDFNWDFPVTPIVAFPETLTWHHPHWSLILRLSLSLMHDLVTVCCKISSVDCHLLHFELLYVLLFFLVLLVRLILLLTLTAEVWLIFLRLVGLRGNPQNWKKGSIHILNKCNLFQ